MLWVAILSIIHCGVQFRMLTRWWRIQFSARTVRVGSEFIRLAYLVSWSWMEDLCIHLMFKKWHGRLPFLKLYTNFKQLRSKRPLIGSNSNCLNNGSVFMNRWHSHHYRICDKIYAPLTIFVGLDNGKSPIRQQNIDTPRDQRQNLT